MPFPPLVCQMPITRGKKPCDIRTAKIFGPAGQLPDANNKEGKRYGSPLIVLKRSKEWDVLNNLVANDAYVIVAVLGAKTLYVVFLASRIPSFTSKSMGKYSLLSKGKSP